MHVGTCSLFSKPSTFQWGSLSFNFLRYPFKQIKNIHRFRESLRERFCQNLLTSRARQNNKNTYYKKCPKKRPGRVHLNQKNQMFINSTSAKVTTLYKYPFSKIKDLRLSSTSHHYKTNTCLQPVLKLTFLPNRGPL